MFSQQQQQQPPATPGPLTLNHLGQQQQPQQQQYSWGTQQPAQVQPFGSQQQQQPGTPQSNYSAPQQQEHTPWIQAAAAAQQQQQQQQASSSPWSNSQAAAPQPQSTSPSQSSSSDAQYIPGYLLKLKGNRPYSSPARTEPHSPPSHDSTSPTRRTPMRGNVGRSDTVVSFAEAGRSSSPNRGFASSFFAAAPASDLQQQQREGSIFGPGGLRNSRRSATAQLPQQQDSPGFGSGPTRRRSAMAARSSSGLGFSPPRAVGSAMDDDDAPPAEALHDESVAYTGAADDAQSSARASVGALFERSESRGTAATDAADLASRTVLVYGFAPGTAQAVAQHFKHIGDTLSCKHEGEAGQALRIVYAESWMALRALSRTGELLPLAGGCYVGVRFADEDAHRHVTLHGLDATADTGVRDSVMIQASPRPASTSMTSISRASTPLIGRPISMIGESTSAILKRPTPAKTNVASRVDAGDAPQGSPFRLRGAGLLSGANTPAPGTPSKAPDSRSTGNSGAGTPSTGVIGRLGDAIFGW